MYSTIILWDKITDNKHVFKTVIATMYQELSKYYFTGINSFSLVTIPLGRYCLS